MRQKQREVSQTGPETQTWWNLRARDTRGVDEFLENLAACVADLAT